MIIKFWGVRGSLPTLPDLPHFKIEVQQLLTDFFAQGFNKVDDIHKFLESYSQRYQHYGVATTCVQLKDGSSELIIDGGSGLKSLSDGLMAARDSQSEYHILISHFHFDHIMGLPFFAPAYIAGKKIKFYSVQSECESVVKGLFQRPIFPVGYEDLKANIEFIRIEPHRINLINGFNVTPYLLDHPDPCYGFRVERRGRSYGHAVDTEANRLTASELGLDIGLYQNLDLLYIDAQYLEEDMSRKKGWGHGTFNRAFELARRYNIKQVLMAHYDPSARFQDIQGFEKRARDVYVKDYSENQFKWSFVKESDEHEI